MASLQSQADAVKSAVTSITTCSPTTTVLLKDLLLAKDAENTTETRNADCRTAKTPRATKARPVSKTTKAGASKDGKDELSAKEKAILATHVINVALKSLGEASKSPQPTPARKQPAVGELAKTASRNALRRSSSSPTTPLHPRSLNRTSTSPAATMKQNRSPTSISSSSGCLSTVECARIAFLTLRTLQNSSKITLPEFQMESGLSSFAGRLIGLGLFEQALKELRILKRRLEGTSGPEVKKTAKPATVERNTLSQSVADLLDFPETEYSGQALNLIITTQLQVLRILAKLKRPSAIEAAISFLRENRKSSPVNLILSSARASTAERAKAARHLETLSQLLLSLTPSVANSDDATAVEPRLSISPTSALELQMLGLQSRLHWWKLADHKGDADKDILSPMSRCLTAYIRRSRSPGSTNYELCQDSFKKIFSEVEAQGFKHTSSLKAPLALIYQAFTTMSKESGKVSQAVAWAEKLRLLVDSGGDTPAKCCAISAQLLALHLKEPWRHLENESLLKEVIDGSQGPLKGDSSELEELLTNLTMVRRAALNLLLGQVADHDKKKFQPTDSTKELLESFILQLPRFCLRWLGKPPAVKGNTKDFLRFEQRRQFLLKSLYPTLDSAMILLKNHIDEKAMTWDQLDSILHDCIALLEHIGDNATNGSSGACYIKISHLYYMQHKALHQGSDTEEKDIGTAFKALRRSIDCIKYRPSKEQEKAQLSFKLERMVELSKALGRIEEALGALQCIRTCLLDDGVLATIAKACQSQPPAIAWTGNNKAESLSRTICSISKMETVWIDWTVHLDEAERLAALEHRLQFILLGNRKKQSETRLSDPCVSTLLDLYSQARFPVRRLRVLIRLLVANIGNTSEFDEIKAMVDELANISESAALGEDALLGISLQHLQAMRLSTGQLTSLNPDFDPIRQALSIWRSLLSDCKTKDNLLHRIDDVAALLEHLRSIADCLRLAGRDDMLIIALQLIADLSKMSSDADLEATLKDQTTLALQLVDHGHSNRAAEIFEELQQGRQEGQISSPEILIECHLSYSEYFLTVGQLEKAEEYLSLAQEASAIENSGFQRSQRKNNVANASVLYSFLAMGRGDAHRALAYARNGVRSLFQDWTRLEQQSASKELGHSVSSTEKDETQEDTSLAMSTCKLQDTVVKGAPGPEFWRLAKPLLRSLLSLSTTYAHLGMHQETMYYADQARKIAETLHSSAYLAHCESWIALVSARAGKAAESLEMAAAAQARLPTNQSSRQLIELVCRLSNTYRELRESALESQMIAKADSMLEHLRSKGSGVTANTDIFNIESKMRYLTISEKPVKAARKTKATTTRSAPKKATTAKSKAPSPTAIPLSGEVSMPEETAAILLQKGASMIVKKDWSSAMVLLQESCSLYKNMPQSSVGLVAMAQSLLGQGLDQMAKDSVFSVVQDSTLSFPSICNGTNFDKAVDRPLLAKASPPRKGRATTTSRERNTSKGRNNEYLENLGRARDLLLEAHSIASVTGDGRLVHQILGMMQTVVLLLSAASSASNCVLGHPGYATYSVEMARNLTWRREKKALLLEKDVPKSGGLDWPEQVKSPDSRRTSFGLSLDINRLQKDYIDIIPPKWSAISISLSENKHDLCITKMQADQSPFIIRLPLERANSRDADNEIFNFQQGRTEILEVIRLANETCHDARDLSIKGAKSAWWADRAALDDRMKDLLENIENIWLGGFKGIFSQHQRRSALLARFQKSFQNVLDKHLPSRRQVRGKRGKSVAPKVTLDPRILELFIGLGDATDPECDFDDALNDLLYFVVDILQFHGERNAYDEIDFDSMVVETFDALHSYHSAVKSEPEMEQGAHTILILDKALHVFPWESLPCMQGQAVSRVPSLACLRRLILEQRSTTEDLDAGAESAKPSGHKVSVKSGSYILNPGADLKTTQATFEKPLLSLGSSWKRIVSNKPTEAEFETALTDSDVLLYFGHGSGAQYIRGRAIRKMEKCRATVLLMGCSSARLADVGDFECHGPVWNYMLAGCPAVVGTLWDVTDRDIDRFAGRVFEEWGLLKKGTFADMDKGKDKSKWKSRAADADGAMHAKRKRAATPDGPDAEDGRASLVEAVARARDACRFRYLTAAAVCVYGIPVYVDK